MGTVGWKRLRRDERGVSTVIAVVSLLALFGAAMLSLDYGNMVSTRRNLITGTDASALDQAKYLAFQPAATSCQLTWTDYLVRNVGAAGTTPLTCTPSIATNGTGWVGVDARKVADTRFGGLFGIGATNPYSFSAAQWGFVSEALNLRPMGFCNQNSHVVTWLALKNGSLSQSAYQLLRGAGDVNGDTKVDYPADIDPSWGGGVRPVHRMYFNNDLDDGACGTFPGNWGWLSFDGLPANTGDRNDWIENGYADGSVRIRTGSESACPGLPGSGDEDNSAEGCVPADSGALSNANSSALDEILHKPIAIMIFDAGACQGGGVTCTFEAWAFAGVILRRYQATGAEASRYFDFEFTNIVLEGPCCGGTPANGVDTGTRGVKICAVDHDNSGLTEAQRCAPTS